ERLLVTERDDAPGWQRRADVAISLGRAYRAVLGHHEGGMRLAVKGAPETLLLACTSRRTESGREALDAAGRLALVRAVETLATQGLRVLAVAERAVAPDATPDPELVVDLCFLGFLAFRDPLRRTAPAAVRGFVSAGVRPVMITGDHPSTARAIAEAAGLPAGARLLTGAELAALGDEALDARIDDVALFARVTPSQKVRIVRALQRRGWVVAMIGDGANDAAAIRLADVGVAFGDASTPAARAAADLVVTGEHLEALLEALAEGRAMWAAVRSAVGLLMGGNLGEIGFTLLAGLLDGSPALHARQLLLVNLFTDIAPAMAIALRPPPPELISAGGNDSADAALGAPLDREMATRALVTTLGATTAWGLGRVIGSRARARTIGLVAVVGTQLGQTIASGGVSRPVLLTSLASAGMLAALVQTPGVSHFFGCRPLGPISWSAAIGASVAATALGRVIDERFSGRLVDEAHRAAEAPRLALSGLLGPG
ncbi:MAG: cation-translocating P-type ATPase, partial [Deltaproteobacteria bacterium]|nr:cation-translocating P-type ATPase [Deltaproteobacteria bacterium]